MAGGARRPRAHARRRGFHSWPARVLGHNCALAISRLGALRPDVLEAPETSLFHWQAQYCLPLQPSIVAFCGKLLGMLDAAVVATGSVFPEDAGRFISASRVGFS